MERTVSLLGLVAFLAACVALCPAQLRKRIDRRLIVLGVGLQFLFAFLVLKTPFKAFFQAANGTVNQILRFTKVGSQFVFGDLVARTDNFGYIFAFQVLPNIVFVSALTAVLYHLGIMPLGVRLVGSALARLLGTSRAESVAAAANIFLGQIESPLVVRPYIATMSDSELLALMVPGMASIGGGVLVSYVGLLEPYFPNIAGHLLAASFMSAPAALVASKLVLPEAQPPAERPPVTFEKLDANLIDAVTRGARDGVGVAVGVAATLICFLALVALVNAALAGLAGLVGLSLSLEGVLGLLFAPFAWLMGVSGPDVLTVGNLLGQKTVLNEFVAFTNLLDVLKPGGTEISERSLTIASYALCGFANFGSVGIQVAGIGDMAPERRADLSRLGLRALIAGSLASFMSAAVVGILI